METQNSADSYNIYKNMLQSRRLWSEAAMALVYICFRNV